MSLKSELYYWIECDRCGERADYGDWSAMADVGQAVEFLAEDWVSVSDADGESYYCPSHTVWSDELEMYAVVPESSDSGAES